MSNRLNVKLNVSKEFQSIIIVLQTVPALPLLKEKRSHLQKKTQLFIIGKYKEQSFLLEMSINHNATIVSICQLEKRNIVSA